MRSSSENGLSPHQKRVLVLILEGKSNVEIQAETGKSKCCVASEVYRICQHFGVQSTRGLFSLLGATVEILEKNHKLT